MKKILSVIILSLLSFSSLYAQNDVDALRYSQLTFGGTARGMGLAGATGAIGGDFSSLSDNPAGLGFYRKNELTFTPGLDFINNKTDFLGSQNTQRATNFNISNFGIVLTHVFDENRVRGWKSVSFAFGMNRLANFNSNVYYSGFNNSNSLINSYLEELNNSGEAAGNIAADFPYDANLAYSTNLITQGSDNVYHSPLENGGLQQSNSISTSGSISEYVLSVAGNYNNKLYVGLTIGIPGLHFNSQSIYTEKDTRDSIPDFNSFSLTNVVNTTGVGINAKFGLIYKLNDYLRLGAAVHSPTYYSLHDSYSTDMTTNYNSGTYESTPSPGIFDYNLITPWKFVGSAAVIFKKYGFISADYEYIDYSQTYYSFNSSSASDIDYQNQQNQVISTKYTGTSNFKVGGELVLEEVFRLRAGYAMYGSPFSSGNGVTGFDNSSNYITGGVGFRENNFYMDLGFAHGLNHSFQQPYSLQASQVPGAQITTPSNDVLLTIGVRY